jgi:putative oxidoreductase
MAQEMKITDSARVERVGQSGIYPISGPLPPGEAPIRGQGALAHPEERGGTTPWPSSLSADAALALGRVLFGGYFFYNGVNHFLNRTMMADYARSKKVPLADVAVPASGTLILLGGLSLLTGMRPKWGASLITAFLLGVTPIMHAFWAIDDPEHRTQELVNFTKNLALIGGAALAAAVAEPWPGSVHIQSDQPIGLRNI